MNESNYIALSTVFINILLVVVGWLININKAQTLQKEQVIQHKFNTSIIQLSQIISSYKTVEDDRRLLRELSSGLKRIKNQYTYLLEVKKIKNKDDLTPSIINIRQALTFDNFSLDDKIFISKEDAALHYLMEIESYFDDLFYLK